MTKEQAQQLDLLTTLLKELTTQYNEALDNNKPFEMRKQTRRQIKATEKKIREFNQMVQNEDSKPVSMR